MCPPTKIPLLDASFYVFSEKEKLHSPSFSALLFFPFLSLCSFASEMVFPLSFCLSPFSDRGAEGRAFVVSLRESKGWLDFCGGQTSAMKN